MGVQPKHGAGKVWGFNQAMGVQPRHGAGKVWGFNQGMGVWRFNHRFNQGMGVQPSNQGNHGMGQARYGGSTKVQGFAESLQQSLKTEDPRPCLIWKK